MIKIIYHVPISQKQDELEWLQEQKIFPAVQEGWDWKNHRPTAQFACIVSPQMALTLKLRHKLDIQDNYNKK